MGQLTCSFQHLPLLQIPRPQRHLGPTIPDLQLSLDMANGSSPALGGPNRVLVLPTGSHDQIVHFRQIQDLIMLDGKS